VACLDDDFEACIAHLKFPLAHRRAIRTTNMLERLFGEARRRTKVIPHAFGERAVLGDGGSNLLGFAAGLGMYLVLADAGVWLAAGSAVVLNVLADTVTLSRLIEGTPPLRWFDTLGRLPPGS